MNVDGICCLCNCVLETGSHLFFKCSFSKSIWEGVLKLCNVLKRVLDWSHEVDWAVKFLKGKSLLVVILKLAWCAFIYLVWRERNHRLFRHTCKSGQDILQAIIEVVQVRLRGKNIVRTDLINSQLCRNWDILV
ncbi:hypothetical protein GQ457_16G008530 [Hibiscus cannabinus]